MFELVLHVCLIDNASRCKYEYLNSTAPSYNQCISDMISIAKYMGDHPAWQIKDWHCNGNGKKEADL